MAYSVAVGIFVWRIFATFYLLRLTYQDVNNNMVINEKLNSYMQGYTIAVVLASGLLLKELLYISLVTIILNVVMSCFKVVGKGDTNAISWLIMGLYVLGLDSVIVFIGLITISFVYLAIKYKEKKPFFPWITGSFILTWVLTHYL